jgi:hypothetical protein
MYQTDKIEFQAERDFGSRLNASFDFIRRNFMPLLTSMLVILVPLLALGGGLGLLLYRYLQNSIVSSGADSVGIVLIGFSIFIFYFLILSFLPAGIIYSYIKLYQERPESVFTVEQVLGELKKHWLRLLGAMILTYIILIPAFLLFIIPGIYLAIPMALIPYIIVSEDLSFFDAMSRAFKMVRDNWWETFGIMVIATIISTLFSYAFQLPITILIGSSSFILDLDNFTSLGFLGILAAVIYMVGSFIIQAIPLTVYAFHYHHLVEIKEGRGMMGRIANLGNTTTGYSAYVDDEETF